MARLTLIVSVGSLCAACAAERPERQREYVVPGTAAVQTLSVPFDADARKDRVRLRPDETLAVRLESRGGPLYGWELAPEEPDPKIVSIVGEPRQPYPPPPPGTVVEPQPKWDVFTFRALRPGSTTVRFRHVDSGKPDAPPTKRSEVTIDVKP